SPLMTLFLSLHLFAPGWSYTLSLHDALPIFDGILPSGVEVFTAQKYSSEESALPEAILNQVKKEEYHDNIYGIDRGLQSTRSMKEFDGQSVKFHSFER